MTDSTDANGVVTHTIYDALNRPVVVIQNYRPPLQPDAETNVRIEYTYNAVGNRTQVKDANGHVTEFHYDALNRVTEKIDPLGNTWQYTYDLAGRLTVQVDGNNKTTSYSYDAAGHLTGIDYPAPEADVTITYNAAGQQTEMTDGQGTTSWTYDDLGRLTSVTHPDGGKVEYTYDLFGRRQTTTSHIDAADLTGKTVTYAYDEDSRLTTVTDWQTQVTQYSYDAMGRVKTIERPNGVTSRYTYDAAGRLTDLAHSQGSETLAAYHYTYDAAGNRLSASEQVLNVPVTAPTQFAVVEQGFTAISLGWPDSTIDETGYRLERSADNQVSWQVIADLPANTLRFVDEGIAPDTQYGYRLTPYDPQGDGPAETLAAETQPVVTISYTYDALQRLTAASYNDGTIFDYTYDATGNTLELSKTVAGQSETTVYTYDIANQLATAQAGSGTAWQYQYDGNGSLVEMTPGEQAASGAKRYTYNTAGQLTKVETHDGSGYQPQAEMIYDGQGQRLAMTAHQGSLSLTSRYLLDGQTTLAATASGQTTYYLRGVGEFQADWRYYLPDGMGNVRQVTDGQGQVAGTRSYTPWGEILEQSGQTDLTTGYLGGMLDAATGLIYVGNGQYYDPATGRFLTRNANPSQTNPYVPWKSDPAGAMLAPLALLAMVYGRKKKRGKWDQIVIVLVLALTAGMGLSACSSPGWNLSVTPESNLENPTLPPNLKVTVTAPGGETLKATLESPAEPPTVVPTEDLCGMGGRDANKRYDIIVFGGSKGQAYMKEAGPSVPVSVRMWATDNEGKDIYEKNLVPYPAYMNVGTENQISGKAIQQENAKGISPCDNVIIIGYSAGTEAAIMYAKWRVEQEPNQPVRAVVLLGPTFGSYNESGKGTILKFGTTEVKNDGTPSLIYDDWADYVTRLLISNVDVYVFADNGTTDQAPLAQNYGNSYNNIKGVKGTYVYDPQQATDHTTTTVTDTTIKDKVYNWIYNH